MNETLKRRLVGITVLSLIVLMVAWWLPDRNDGQKRLNPERLPTETRVYDIHALDQQAEQLDNQAAAEAASPPNVDPASEAAVAQPPELESPPEAMVTSAPATPKPTTSPKPAPKPAPEPAPVTVAPKPEPKPAPQPVAESKPETPPAIPQTTTVPDKPAQPLPSGDWVVQVGSYGKQANAESMRQRLEAKGYRVAITSGQVSGRTYHRVRVGPYTKKADAQTAAGKLEKLLDQKVAVLKNH